MTLSAEALATLDQAKSHLRIDAASSLHIDAEYVGEGDGADLTFDLDNTPIDGSLKLYVNNVLQVETTNYSISTATITFVVAPPLGHPITATYDKVAGDDTFLAFDDALIDDIIEAATMKAESYTGRAFIQRSITEDHLGDGSEMIKLYKKPIASVTSVSRLYQEAVGTGDGTTVLFSLDNTPVGAISLYVDGVLKTLTTDYTIDGADITFVAAPADESDITAKYYHTIKPINEYKEMIPIGRLKAINTWANGSIFRVVYTAGYAATRAATQALVPNVLSAVLMIVAYLYENRTDLLKVQQIASIGSVTYDIPSQAMKLLDPYVENFF